jgi:hypothetical protein
MPSMFNTWIIRFVVFGVVFGSLTGIFYLCHLPTPYVWGSFIALFLQKKLLRAFI